MFVKGSIPGSKNTMVLIKKNAKKINRVTILEKTAKLKAETAKSGSDEAKKSKDKKNKEAPKPIGQKK
jgi:large subunit ribosomal protein L3